MKMKNKEAQLSNWVMFPRDINSDFRNGKITRNEYIILMYLRLDMNPYGISKASLEDIKNDLLIGVQKNYVNKLLLSLKDKRYLYYPSRAGRRGSFEIHFGEIVLPTGHIRTLDKFFTPIKGRSYDEDPPPGESEDSQTRATRAQNLQELESNKQKLVGSFSFNEGRGSNNDTKTKKYNKNETTTEYSFSKYPKSQEEQRCYEIARAVDEKSPRFIIVTMKRYGISLIEKAWEIYQEEIKLSQVEDNAAYFNSIISRMTKNK